MALAGVSRPTALPIRACLVGKLDRTIAIRASPGSNARRRACPVASAASRAQRSRSGA
jgi:hypothetical protein